MLDSPGIYHLFAALCNKITRKRLGVWVSFPEETQLHSFRLCKRCPGSRREREREREKKRMSTYKSRRVQAGINVHELLVIRAYQPGTDGGEGGRRRMNAEVACQKERDTDKEEDREREREKG